MLRAEAPVPQRPLFPEVRQHPGVRAPHESREPRVHGKGDSLPMGAMPWSPHGSQASRGWGGASLLVGAVPWGPNLMGPVRSPCQWSPHPGVWVSKALQGFSLRVLSPEFHRPWGGGVPAHRGWALGSRLSQALRGAPHPRGLSLRGPAGILRPWGLSLRGPAGAPRPWVPRPGRRGRPPARAETPGP